MKLIQAAALAAILMPLGSVALEAATISYSTCGFYSFESEDGCSGSPGSDSRTFGFDFGTLTLTLLGLTQSTDITITNATLTQTEFSARNMIADANCITVMQPGIGDEGCRQLMITASNPDAFTGWIQETFWNFDTNTAFPNGTDPAGAEPGQVRVYRGEGTLTTALFTEDMCLQAAAGADGYTPCEYFPDGPFFGDPGIRSGNTDFSVITYAEVAPVPEPCSLALLGTGLGALVLRRRRRANA